MTFEDQARKDFESWISGPPYERGIERFGDRSAWPGNYKELDVDLAWLSWIASATAARDEHAKLCDVIEGGRFPDGEVCVGVAAECALAIREGLRSGG